MTSTERAQTQRLAPLAGHSLIFLLFATLSALFLAPALFGDRALLPTDLLAQMSPGAAASGPGQSRQPWNPILWDAIAQFYPWRAFAAHWMRRGVIPLWDPHQFCGTPFLANSQSAILYPLHLLLLDLPTGLSVARGMALLTATHLTLAGFLTYLWLQSLRVDPFAAVLGGTTFMLSGFAVTWLELPSFLTVACWLPLLFLTLRRALEAPSRARSAAVAAAVGLILLGGHLQIAFYCLLSAALYALTRSLPPHRPTRQPGTPSPERRATRRTLTTLGSLLGATLLGGMLAAPQVLPAMELSRQSHRVSSASARGYEAYVDGAMPVGHLVRLFLPDFYGNPTRGDYIAGSPADYTELAAYIGGVGLLLALAGLLAARRRPQETTGAVLIGGVALLLALGTPLNSLLYFGIPGFSQSGSPARVLVLFCFASAWLAALGAEALLEAGGEQPGSRSRVASSSPPPGALPLGALTLWLALLGVTLLLARSWCSSKGIEFGPLLAASGPALRRTILFALIAMALPAGVARLSRAGALSAALAAFLGRGSLGTLLIGELWLLGASFNPTGLLAEVYPRTPLVDALTGGPAVGTGRVLPVNRRWSLYRQPRAELPPNSALAMGLLDPQGYDSLFLGSYKGFTRMVQRGRDSAPPENGNMLFLWDVDSPLFPLLAADRVVLREDAGVTPPSNWPILFRVPGVQVRRCPSALPRAFVAPSWRSVAEGSLPDELARLAAAHELGKTALIEGTAAVGGGQGPGSQVPVWEIGPNQVTLETGSRIGPGMLLLLDNAAPGWRASDEATGRPLPVYRADMTFRAVPLARAGQRVRMRYEPASFRLGLFLAMLAAGVLAALAISGGSGRGSPSPVVTAVSV